MTAKTIIQTLDQIPGPQTSLGKQILAMKYLQPGESFREMCSRVASALTNDSDAFMKFRQQLLTQGFIPGGRILSTVGSARAATALNCFVSGTIEDSMEGIMKSATDAAMTMRMGGGIGYDFSTIRPSNSNIKSLNAPASGPVSFMRIFDAVCKTVASAGQRRGAQMGVLRVDHPDILEFIRAKRNSDDLTTFNIAVGLTDEFMRAVDTGATSFPLTFNGDVHGLVNPQYVWEELMRSSWDWADPGVLFLDIINRTNNNHLFEVIAASNPCAEQPLPPNGSCLLGSFNLPKFVVDGRFSYYDFARAINAVVPAMDRVGDVSLFPLPEQEEEFKQTRRMGLGVMGLATAGEMCGYQYGSSEFLEFTALVLGCLRDEAYYQSAALAEERGAAPRWSREQFQTSEVYKSLPPSTRRKILTGGMRNTHLTTLAPTGTTALIADNVSGGIEPPFALRYDRTYISGDGSPVTEEVQDYAYRVHGIEGVTAGELTPQQHLDVLLVAQKYIDSGISKTINVGDGVSYDEFKQIYMDAWKGGAKGCATFRMDGKRYGVLNQKDDDGPKACYIDHKTGAKECS